MNLSIIITTTLLFTLQCFAEKNAKVEAHCYSFSLLPLDTYDGYITYFTTYDESTAFPLGSDQNILSTEVKPAYVGSNVFYTDYLGVSRDVGIEHYGALTITFPATDSNVNGVLDFLEINLAVNTTATFSLVDHWDYYGNTERNTANVSFQRSSGSSVGSYTINSPDGYSVTGEWALATWSGDIEYNANKQLSLNLSRPNPYGVTEYAYGSGTYEYSENQISIGVLTVNDGAGIIETLPANLSRSGKTFSGLIQLEDGTIETPWADFTHWKIFITDNNDEDGDGMPDLTDPTPKNIFNRTESLGNGWFQHEVLGTFFAVLGEDWYYHIDLGWIYVPEWDDHGTWFWSSIAWKELSGYWVHDYGSWDGSVGADMIEGWTWTNSEVYPYLYNNSEKDWRFIKFQEGVLLVWSENSKNWFFYNEYLDKWDTFQNLDFVNYEKWPLVFRISFKEFIEVTYNETEQKWEKTYFFARLTENLTTDKTGTSYRNYRLFDATNYPRISWSYEREPLFYFEISDERHANQFLSYINNFTNSSELLNTLANSLHNTEEEKYSFTSVISHFGYSDYRMEDFEETDGIVDLLDYAQTSVSNENFAIKSMGDIELRDGDWIFNHSNQNTNPSLYFFAGDDQMLHNGSLTFNDGNLAFAAEDETSDSFWLADFKINAGGKINIESRGTINISNSEINSNQNFNASKPIVTRLFAYDFIALTNAKFTSKENNQVTLEAPTIRIRSSDFPEGVPIDILTRDGTISFNSTNSDGVFGSLNLFNVKVGNKLLRVEDFRQSEGTYESVFTTSDGTPLISVKKI